MLKINWPEPLKNNHAARALESSLGQNRLGHGLLFVADDSLVADEAAKALASALLKSNLPCADYLRVEPTNKQRQIGVDPMRELREFLQKGSFSGVKVAHISQADRLSTTSANLFLKILEEPPADSYVIMTTSEPYAVLPTLVSRSMRFRFSQAESAREESIERWREEFQQALMTGVGNASSLMNIYALINNAYALLMSQEDAAERAASKAAKDDGDDTPKEVLEAMEVARQKAYKKALFSALEAAALEVYKAHPKESFHLTAALKSVERVYRLLDFNLNTAAAVESAVGGVVQALG